jgi:hypothetical protein
MSLVISLKSLTLRPRKLFILRVLGLSVVSGATVLLSRSSEARHAASAQRKNDLPQPRIRESFGAVPLSFEMNQGQTDKRVKFIARGSGGRLFLTSAEAVFALTPKPSRHSSSRPSIGSDLGNEQAAGI